MMPKINPKQMQSMMKQMGISQESIEAYEVIIRCPDKDIVVVDPEVAKVHMMGQLTWQITGNAEERPREVSISKDDIQTVIDQTNVSEAEAKAAIEKNHGDLAQAILSLSKEE